MARAPAMRMLNRITVPISPTMPTGMPRKGDTKYQRAPPATRDKTPRTRESAAAASAAFTCWTQRLQYGIAQALVLVWITRLPVALLAQAVNSVFAWPLQQVQTVGNTN